MMPPKKSKAARAATEDSVVTEKEKPAVVIDEKKKEEDGGGGGGAGGEHLQHGTGVWQEASGRSLRIENHLEENEEVNYHASDVYNIYLEGCISSNTFAVELVTFAREVKQRFPKGFCVRADSPYHGAVKERKKRKEKKEKTARSPSDALKTRELLKKKGLRFNTIKKLLIGKHPALQLDARPALLKSALNRALYFGHVRLVKGIGCAGFYRWVVKGEEEEEEEPKGEKKSKTDKRKKEEENGISSDAKTDEEGEKGEENGEEKEGEKEGDEKSGEQEKKKKRKKKKKKQQKSAWSSQVVVHSEPEKISDCFQMAMTFMSDPKLASVSRIKKYILDHYHQDVDMEKLRKVLQAGVDQGSWGQVTGASATSGSYQLLLEDFDPMEDDELAGKITNAIMASHEPKQCSFGLLKRYVAKYHPDFKVEERPSRMRKAVERALDQGLLRRLTGIGCSGTFQLAKPFVPSPSVLAGNDTASDYEEYFSGHSDAGIEKGVKGFQVEDFQDAYKPRPTKRHGRQAATKAPAGVTLVPKTEKRGRPPKSAGRPAKSAGQPKVQKKQPKYRDTSSEEESEEEEVVVKKKKKSVSKKTTPKKTAKKGKQTNSKKSSPVKGKKTGKKTSTPKKTPKKDIVVESDTDDDDDDDDDDEVDLETRRVATKAARKAKPPSVVTQKKKAVSGKRKKAEMGSGRASLRASMVSYVEVSDSDAEDEPQKKRKKKKKN
ncbi:hypothetical protein CAPTEDRAFT_224518 [Capitella teleta]|uniref:H15 domain-containing protein n=1 Tax=Capitella teleta TaxID=283909 RepID=R7TTF1_CAPTE|nr:hypothetical protein CAPTEDRAFT_224518 [Capitella teleta]|eukprot:ELT96877.1 hypothetical protein CAPTEDRAFT_224518 [Capitella teleta]